MSSFSHPKITNLSDYYFLYIHTMTMLYVCKTTYIYWSLFSIFKIEPIGHQELITYANYFSLTLLCHTYMGGFYFVHNIFDIHTFKIFVLFSLPVFSLVFSFFAIQLYNWLLFLPYYFVSSLHIYNLLKYTFSLALYIVHHFSHCFHDCILVHFIFGDGLNYLFNFSKSRS